MSNPFTDNARLTALVALSVSSSEKNCGMGMNPCRKMNNF